jgi:NAD(P)-dependent dehydrogenase (short-subunit alcohol dehydrogenase family)
MGTPAVVVNNAGIDRPPGVSAKTMRLENISFAECQRIVEVNLLGLFQVCQEFLPSLVATQGAIVNVGSLYASISPDPRLYAHLPCDPPFIKPPMYGASKAAVVNLTRYLAVHLAPSGVRVNCLSPGGVRAEQDGTFVEGYASRVPMGRMAELEDLVGPFLFLASDASRYVTGQNLCVDGGFQCW